MKAYFKTKSLLLIFMVSVILLTGCVSGSNGSISGGDTHISTSYTCEKPEDWQQIDSDSEDRVTYINENESSISVFQQKLSSASLSGAAYEAQNMLTFNFSEIEFIGDPADIIIDSKNAKILEFSMAISTPEKYRQYIIKVLNVYYIIQYKSPIDTFDKDLPVIEEFVKGIKFNDR